jgi:hypothetical protein
MVDWIDRQARRLAFISALIIFGFVAILGVMSVFCTFGFGGEMAWRVTHGNIHAVSSALAMAISFIFSAIFIFIDIKFWPLFKQSYQNLP